MNAITAPATGLDSTLFGMGVGSAPAAKVEEAAKQVEGLFVSMLMKQMRQSMASEMFSGDGADIYGGMFDQSMGEEIAKGGGFGLVEQLQPKGVSVKA